MRAFDWYQMVTVNDLEPRHGRFYVISPKAVAFGANYVKLTEVFATKMQPNDSRFCNIIMTANKRYLQNFPENWSIPICSLFERLINLHLHYIFTRGYDLYTVARPSKQQLSY